MKAPGLSIQGARVPWQTGWGAVQHADLPYESAVVDLPVRAAGDIPGRYDLQLEQYSMSCYSANQIALLGWPILTCMHA